MNVVSDSSPLIAFARIGRLSLLASLYGRIMISPEVHHEVTVAGRGLPGAEEVRKASWIKVAGELSGDARTILLAKAVGADLVLLDEWKARRVAQEAGLSVVGCLGVLEVSARKGLVPDLREVYIDLLRHGIRFDLRLLQESLARLGLPKL